MFVEHSRVVNVDGPLIAIQGVREAAFEEVVEIEVGSGGGSGGVVGDAHLGVPSASGGGDRRLGRVLQIDGDVAIVQVFEGTSGISLSNARARFTGRPLELKLSPEILGRVFDGLGRPIDGMGDIFPETRMDINGSPMNPVSRRYPRNFIQTGISSIDGLMTLIRGQKLPIFSGSGLAHNELAAQLVRQAKITGGSEGKGGGERGGEGEGDAGFAIVFAAMGVKNDVADFFKKAFEDSGVIGHVAMFVNLASDPPVERIVTPRSALTAAEYLAFTLGMDILVIMTDITAYCESLREISSSKGEIPSRKGFPGYMYSDLASLYERAGLVEGCSGTITQLPILTMPNDDITHPIPDLTGYITEGQIVLDRDLSQKGCYPPVSVLASLSRLMKDGIGAGYTRDDHQQCSAQLFSSYARVQDIRSLASVIGEDELSGTDKLYMEFGRAFEDEFISQGRDENRPMEATLDLGWKLLGILPPGELDRVDKQVLARRLPQSLPQSAQANT